MIGQGGCQVPGAKTRPLQGRLPASSVGLLAGTGLTLPVKYCQTCTHGVDSSLSRIAREHGEMTSPAPLQNIYYERVSRLVPFTPTVPTAPPPPLAS